MAGQTTVNQRQQEWKKVPSEHGSRSQHDSCHRSEHFHIITQHISSSSQWQHIRTYGKHILTYISVQVLTNGNLQLMRLIGLYWEQLFLRAHSLLVALNSKHPVDANTLTSTPLVHTSLLAPHQGSITNSTDNYASLIAKFITIIAPQFTQLAPKHGVEHFVPTPQGPPVHAKARRLPLNKLAMAKAELDNI